MGARQRGGAARPGTGSDRQGRTGSALLQRRPGRCVTEERPVRDPRPPGGTTGGLAYRGLSPTWWLTSSMHEQQATRNHEGQQESNALHQRQYIR